MFMASPATSRPKQTFIRLRCRSSANWAECEDLERAFATNVLGPFRLTKALLGALSAAAREHGAAVVLNVSSDAAINPYPTWGAYGATKAALHHLTRIWDAELETEGVRFLAIDPGDMDTPLHAIAVPDADPATLKKPETSALEVLDSIGHILETRDRHAAAAPDGGRL